MIEAIQERNINGIDFQKVREADFLLIDDKVFLEYQRASKIFTELIKMLERDGYLKSLKGGDYNLNQIVMENVQHEIERRRNPNAGLEPDDLLYTDPN